MINKLAQEIYKTNQDKGFHDNEKNIGEMLMLIVSEAAEALECDRKDKYANINNVDNTIYKINTNSIKKTIDCYDIDDVFKRGHEKYLKDTFEDELADIMIRVMGLAAYKGIDLEWHIKAKMRYNKLRPHKHNKLY